MLQHVFKEGERVVMLYICPGTWSVHHLVTKSVCSETEHALYLSSHMQSQQGMQ